MLFNKRLFLFILTILLGNLTYANECTITHYVVPPASKLNWNSEKQLIKSSSKSFILASKISRFDIPRKMVGHIVTQIKTPQKTRWTSISIKSNKTIIPMLRNGISAIFKPTKGAHFQNKKEIIRFIYNNRSNLLYIQDDVPEKSCTKIIEKDTELRKSKLNFNPTQNNIDIGGTGTSYAVYMLKETGNYIPTTWEQTFITRNNIAFVFHDPQRIWNWIQTSSLKLQQKLKYKRKVFTVTGTKLN